MIPLAQSHEGNQDSEPNLAVNPADPKQIAGSALTLAPWPVGPLDTPYCSECQPCPGCRYPKCAPIFVSKDGGNTWWLNNIIPGYNQTFPTHDITLRFGGFSNQLYAAILRGDVTGGPGTAKLNIFRIPDFLSNARADSITGRQPIDQPHVQATTVLGGDGSRSDRVYVGDNLYESSMMTTTLKTASVDLSLDAFDAPAPAGFGVQVIEESNGAFKNGSAIMPFIHPLGYVYALFYRYIDNLGTTPGAVEAHADLILVRDNNWGQNNFTDLKESGVSGKIVIPNVTVGKNSMLGNNRLKASNLSIAVDPNNDSAVYVAWADNQGSPNTLHVAKSTMAGENPWLEILSPPIQNAINPALAVNMDGKVGFLYQHLTGTTTDDKWETHLKTLDARSTTWNDIVLCQTRWDTPCVKVTGTEDCPNQPYLGDYAHLMAVGKDFYGIFSASNYPDPDHNFPQGVTYQREHDFTLKKLYSSSTHSAANEVAISIDPFFFHVAGLDSASDFYVRDFTNSDLDFDSGLEPSTSPRFCATSDVWNRRDGGPGTYNSDGPDCQDPQLATDGHNFAFARVRRNKPARDGTAPVSVFVNYYYAVFGTGNNFLPIPGLITLPFSSDQTDQTTPSLQWDLPAASTHHVCLAAEIHTNDDPFIGNTLDHYKPGWSTGTDLLMINDNNRAQRNMNLFPVPMGLPIPPGMPPDNMDTTNDKEKSSADFYAVIHNPSLDETDIQLQIEGENITSKDYSNVSILSYGSEFVSLDTNRIIILHHMKPGETRTLKFHYILPSRKRETKFPVTFNQVKNGVIVNAFTFMPTYVADDTALREITRYDASVFARINVQLKSRDTADLIREHDLKLMAMKITSDEYFNHLSKTFPFMQSTLSSLIEPGKGDLFELKKAMNQLKVQIERKDISRAAIAHMSLLNTIDAYLTYRQLEKGNVADVLQTMYLQSSMINYIISQNKDTSLGHLIELSDAFIGGFEKRALTIDDYPGQLKNMISDLKGLAVRFGKRDDRLMSSLKTMELKTDPAELQGEHIKFLLLLKELIKQK